jgi:KDO2-lipid IV(A) lauroyltransferase
MWRAVELLPPRVARGLPRRIGRIWSRAAPTAQREQVVRNLTRVLGRAPEAALVEEAFVSYARYWLDAFRLHRMDVEEVIRTASSVGLHHVDRIRDSGIMP